MAKTKENRLKATFWTEDGARHQIDSSGYKHDHMLAIYKLAVGSFNDEQMRRIVAALEDVPDEAVTSLSTQGGERK